jgi:fatty-acyl-CoA synthase
MAGSSSLPQAYLEKFHERGVPVGQIYGTTETGPVSVILKFQGCSSKNWLCRMAAWQFRTAIDRL